MLRTAGSNCPVTASAAAVTLLRRPASAAATLAADVLTPRLKSALSIGGQVSCTSRLPSTCCLDPIPAAGRKEPT